VFDSQGVAVPVTLYFQKTATDNEWEVYDSLDLAAPSRGTITFDNNGATTGPVAPAPATGFGLTLPVDLRHPTPTTSALQRAVNLDDVTQFGTKFAVSDLKQDGYTSGELTGINVGQTASSWPLLQRRDARRRPDRAGQLPQPQGLGRRQQQLGRHLRLGPPVMGGPDRHLRPLRRARWKSPTWT
jgi:hypothetical protein